MAWWTWVIIAWVVVAALLAVLLGTALHEAERRDWARRGRPERRLGSRDEAERRLGSRNGAERRRRVTPL